MGYKKYPNYINRVGIEFEGCYSHKIIPELKKIKELVFTEDSSVKLGDLSSSFYKTYEVKTKPLGSKKLFEIIGIYTKLQKNKDYIVNYSCGLHFHVSLKKTYQGYVQNLEFYEEVKKMFQKKYPTIYNDRKDNGYCRVSLSESELTSQFNRASYNRYHLVNFSLEGKKKIPTIEIRFYGGKYAKVKELYNVIFNVFKIIGKFLKKEKEIKYKEEYKSEAKKMDLIYDEPVLKKEIEGLKIEPLRFYSKNIKKRVRHSFKSEKKSKDIIINFNKFNYYV